MHEDKHRVCPLEKAGSLESRFRRWMYNPHRILKGYVKREMSVLDFGCGPGVYALELARLVGETGRVIAVDLQQGMLDRLEAKLDSSNKGIITLHRCDEDKIGVAEKVDFILAFFVMHEVPSQENFFREANSLLNPGGSILMVEPNFRVTKPEFEACRDKAVIAGFKAARGPSLLMARSILLVKPSPGKI